MKDEDNSIKARQRMIARMYHKDASKDEDIEWITTKSGQHVPLKDGKAVGGPLKGQDFSQAKSELSGSASSNRVIKSSVASRNKQMSDDIKAAHSKGKAATMRVVESTLKSLPIGTEFKVTDKLVDGRTMISNYKKIDDDNYEFSYTVPSKNGSKPISGTDKCDTQTIVENTNMKEQYEFGNASAGTANKKVSDTETNQSMLADKIFTPHAKTMPKTVEEAAQILQDIGKNDSKQFKPASKTVSKDCLSGMSRCLNIARYFKVAGNMPDDAVKGVVNTLNSLPVGSWFRIDDEENRIMAQKTKDGKFECGSVSWTNLRRNRPSEKTDTYDANKMVSHIVDSGLYPEVHIDKITDTARKAQYGLSTIVKHWSK